MAEPVSEQGVLEFLDAMGIEAIRTRHPAVFTVEQARMVDEHLPGAQCKNLFLRNKKGNRTFLAIFDDQTRVNLKELGEKIGAGGLSLASPEQLRRVLGVEPGSVGPFGLLNPGASEVTLLVEERLRESSQASFHPNINTSTLTLRWQDFERYLQKVGNPVIWV